MTFDLEDNKTFSEKKILLTPLNKIMASGILQIQIINQINDGTLLCAKIVSIKVMNASIMI